MHWPSFTTNLDIRSQFCWLPVCCRKLRSINGCLPGFLGIHSRRQVACYILTYLHPQKKLCFAEPLRFMLPGTCPGITHTRDNQLSCRQNQHFSHELTPVSKCERHKNSIDPGQFCDMRSCDVFPKSSCQTPER